MQWTATGIAFCCYYLGVPVTNGKPKLNDHDRSDRYTAVDFASDYLNSCAPKAILFTNGDMIHTLFGMRKNVEGIRSDIRVII